ncbi:MAG TPA: hypothetical protein P5572_12995 [Phycisphaerae bacterium]|nr:hypothetical protein [Phycisphaerae bacterium]
MDGRREFELAIGVGTIGFLAEADSGFIPGCSAEVNTTDALTEYKVVKIGTAQVHVYVNGAYAFSCPYEKFAGRTRIRATLLKTSASGTSSFRLASMRYAFGASSFETIARDINNNALPDDCEPPDFDLDGTVDLYDFAAFQLCLGTNDPACLAAFDRATPPDNLVGDDDLPFFVAYLAGPAATGGLQTLLAGGEGGGSLMASAAGGPASLLPAAPDSPAEPLTASLAIEVQPVGGGAALTTLEADTEYELHYTAGNDAINTMLVMAISSNAVASITAAAAAPTGDWADADNFTFTDERSADPPAPAPGYAEGLHRYGLVMDGFWGETASAGATGSLCRITTGGAGALTLDVQLIGDDTGQIVLMSATQTWTVE